MAEVIKMPKMSDTMEEGVIATWLKKVGDKVKAGDILAEVETDKATMELESYQDGTLLHIGIKEKESVPVDGIIAIIGNKGEDISMLLSESNRKISKTVENEAKSTVKAEKAEEIKQLDVDVSKIKASVIRMPKMSDTMTEGIIATWLKKVGDKIASGDILAEVETDKATMELESYEDGTLLYTAVEAGSGVPVNDIIAIIGEKGADFKTLLAANKSPKVTTEPAAQVELKVAEVVKPADSKPNEHKIEAVTTNGRVIASPLAKKLAEEKGINITQVSGSGDGGRIIKRDVENFTPSAARTTTATELTKTATSAFTLPSVVGKEASHEISLSQMRKVIAKRLSESKFTAPHFYITMEIVMDKAIEARNSMNDVSPVKISFNDMVIKAVAASIRQNPDVNVSWMGDKMVKHDHIHIGVAVAIPDGLIVPVVRFADNKSLSHISAEVKELGQKAKNKTLQPQEFSGNTFTISNLGMFGVEEFTAIINPPDACILAIGGIKETVIVKNGEMKAGNVMKVTLSCDHRAVDGAIGAAFLKTLKGLLEDPVRILI